MQNIKKHSHFALANTSKNGLIHHNYTNTSTVEWYIKTGWTYKKFTNTLKIHKLIKSALQQTYLELKTNNKETYNSGLVLAHFLGVVKSPQLTLQTGWVILKTFRVDKYQVKFDKNSIMKFGKMWIQIPSKSSDRAQRVLVDTNGFPNI